MARNREILLGGGAVRIPADALDWQFARSAGPGGQHVNRTSSKAVLRFDARGSAHLPEDVRRRLLDRERSRLTRDGCIVITSQRHRDQPSNVADCLAKLSLLIERAMIVPKVRRRTKTPRAEIARRLESKRRRAATKRLRGRPEE
ncbi:MAG: aminoacyl-tRNA hydrolase [Planctomycetia bacterium]|nr:aminoacyl-tRNA hydrolase [Planctomycetia bacterium]